MEDIETVDAPEGYSWTLSRVGWGTGANFYQLKLKRWGLLTVATESFFSDGLRGPATEDEFRRQTANAARKILRGMETKRSWARNIERALNAGRERGDQVAISITGDGMAIALDGDAGITYDRKAKTLTVRGLGPSDRVITRTDSRDESQTVIVQFGAAKYD